MGDFNASRAGRTAATATLHTASDAARDFLSHGRGVLVAHWGQDYSQNWASAGWTNNTTAVPNSQPDRLALVQALAGFLKANPTYEANVPPIVFTAAEAGSVAQALQDALDGWARPMRRPSPPRTRGRSRTRRCGRICAR